LFAAASDGNFAMERHLLKSGADIDRPNLSGQTPLIIASYHKHTCMQML
jgi:ankyrin repeat protein